MNADAPYDAIKVDLPNGMSIGVVSFGNAGLDSATLKTIEDFVEMRTKTPQAIRLRAPTGRMQHPAPAMTRGRASSVWTRSTSIFRTESRSRFATPAEGSRSTIRL